MSKAKIKISLPMELFNKLFIQSIRYGVSMSEIVRRSLTERFLVSRLPKAANDN